MTEPSTDPCFRLSFGVGVAENKNSKYRPTMEDVHTYVANFAERLDWGYFAVFDGHAGKLTAKWCGNNLHAILEEEMAQNETQDLRVTLNNTFTKADEALKEQPGNSGCTAAVAVLRWELTELEAESPALADAPFDFVPTANHRRVLYTANVGDSRVVLCRWGKAYRLSYDHKGSDINEAARISNAGGIMIKSRVNGMLAVTRSLGDSYMKDLVVGNPFATATEITKDDSFVIIACDGLWDVCTDQQAVELINNVEDPDAAARKLVNHAMNKLTTDNITVMVIRLDKRVFEYKGKAV
ncbi:hypothetical protein BABINDRAFT_160629 [Babjeviella inositovora NRRL Y-12698]|uniref:PPM-type phosphatase domain-containing protein n=1 Tax=Babjeviella inositovora NRRL Y-12698 TaxID=984486 RepID=A0A1E3QVY8_9ASCO|nr:uncharacterized protein BABINDRAFT_160629 [Babjeviella inositovora NRRL Y-12698]ODQ81252.1 hypothetical protein BABINDRAFT_160629 [Babjeviella inositovora NRRL Y-12698]